MLSTYLSDTILLEKSCSYRETSKQTDISRNTVAKYSTGDPWELSRYGISQSKLEHINYIIKTYPLVWEIRTCIKSFRSIFTHRNMPELYLFIEQYRRHPMPELKSFAKGLFRDIEAVENAVTSNLSNGFVEGTNNKLKMIKRTMYGRCGRKLLNAKMMLRNTI